MKEEKLKIGRAYYCIIKTSKKSCKDCAFKNYKSCKRCKGFKYPIKFIKETEQNEIEELFAHKTEIPCKECIFNISNKICKQTKFPCCPEERIDEEYVVWKKEKAKLEHGDSCTCTIEGKKITNAKISIYEGRTYICQNIITGSDCLEKFGYRYSWVMSNSVKDLK